MKIESKYDVGDLLVSFTNIESYGKNGPFFGIVEEVIVEDTYAIKYRMCMNSTAIVVYERDIKGKLEIK